MGQYWEIVSIDDRETCPKVAAKLGGFFWDPQVGLSSLLTLPQCLRGPNPFRGWAAEFKGEKTPAEAADARRVQIANSKILQLPVDILRMILDEVDSVEGLLCLCFVHELIGELLEDTIYGIYLDWYTPWRESRIACIGDYTNDDDYPSTLQATVTQSLTREREKAQERHGDTTLQEDHSELDEDGGQFYDLISAYPLIYPVKYPLLHTAQLLGTVSLTPSDKRKYHNLMSAIRQFCEFEDPATDSMQTVLRNVSKGVYVRGDAVFDLHKKIGSRITFDQVLLSQICWSSDDSCAMECDWKRLTRGPWAGDKFEIVRVDLIRDDIQGSDVTDAVLSWVEELWTTSQAPYLY